MSDFITTKTNGNTLDASEWNQLAEIDNAIDSSGLVLTTAQTDQLKISMSRYSSGADFYTDGGSANAYVLTSISHGSGKSFAPAGAGAVNYFNGMRVRFRPANNNSGASTINVSSFGIKDIRRANGTSALTGGELTTATDVILRYDSTNNCFIIQEYIQATTTTLGVSYAQPSPDILINGEMAIDQRNNGASQTITAGASLAYTVDRWYAYCTGANCTGQRVAGTSPNQYTYRFTGASSVSKIGFAQRIESANSQHLAGKSATLSVDLANSLLTTITWTMWYANTTDTFGTLASPTRTQIATGTFTVNSTLTRYNTTISIPSSATTGIEIEFSAGSQTSGTFTIGGAKLEIGLASTPFNYKPISQLLFLCQRYYETSVVWGVSYGASGSAIQRCLLPYKIPKRTTPSVGVTVVSGSLTSPSASAVDITNAWIGFSSASAGLEGKFSCTIDSEL